MLYRILSTLKRRTARVIDYGLVSVRHPKIFVKAAKHVINRRRRTTVSAQKAAAYGRIRGPEQTRPVTADELISGLSEIMGVIVLGPGPKGTSIGVADVDFLSALMFLRHQAFGAAIEIKNELADFDTLGFKRIALRASTVEITFVAPNRDSDIISVEAYFQRDSGEWISNNTDNTQLRALRNDRLTQSGLTDVRDILGGSTLERRMRKTSVDDDRLTRSGLTDVHDILGGPSLERRIKDIPVDAVYTWVNHDDSDWASLFAKYSGEVEETTDAKALSRFHSNDELRYSLRSVAQNAPWIDRIFVLTNCARPDWLDTNDPRLIWVDHAEAIPVDCLPTFNSHVIESCLHRIPDLSEQFLYLNDDVFLARPLEKEFFFSEAGASRSFLEGYGMVSGPVVDGDPDYLNASRNVASLLNAEMGFVPTQLHQHTAFALRRSVLEAIEARWQDRFDALRQNRFRTAGDINVTSFFYHHYAMATGQAQLGEVRNAFVKSMDVRWREKLRGANKPVYDTICINEGGSDSPASDWHPTVNAFLANRFSQKAPWEK